MNDNLLRAAREMVHRAMEGQPSGFAAGPIGVTDYEGAVIWLREAVEEAEREE